MNLKTKEQHAILAGKFPEIVRPDRDFEEGDEFILKTTKTRHGSIPEVSIRITGHYRQKNGAWGITYCVKDDRGVYVAQGLGYTRSPTRALDREAPILDPAVIESYATEGVQKTTLLSAEQRQREKLKGKESRIGSSSRAERAVRRHQKAVERRLSA